jgi:predicted phage terminase large subunit-like protein
MKEHEFDTYTWSREFMNTPIEEGKHFKEQYIIYDHIPPLDQMDSLIVFGDLSYKDAADFKAMPLVGRKGRSFYVVNVLDRQCSRSEVAKWLYNIYEDLSLSVLPVNYYVEGLFAMDEFTSDFDMEGANRGYYIPILPDKKNTQDKHMRIESMLGFFERGDVIFNIEQKNSPDMKNLIQQLLAFEKGSTAPDDGPDALQAAIARINVAAIHDNFDIRTTGIDKFKKNSRHRY